MLVRLADLSIRRRKTILVVALVFFALAGAIGGGVAKQLSTGGFDDSRSQSYKATKYLENTFHQGVPSVVLVVHSARGVDDPATVAAGQRLTARLAKEAHLYNVVSYWSLGSPPPLRSDDSHTALVFAAMKGTQDDLHKVAEALQPKYQGSYDGLDVKFTGYAEIFRQVGTTIERDLKRAELIALPITLILLILIFGGIVAALLPLGIGALSIVGTFLVLRIVSSFTEVSVYALNMTTAMGLGLAIDYSLFIISRYREELAAGFDTDTAVRRTVRTAGRTVAFSATTVAGSLAALLLFPLSFLRSFAYAGIAVVAVGGLASVIVLPAMLVALGPRIDRGRILKRTPKPVGEGFWHRVATAVMRRPLPIATVVIAILLFLGAPFLGIDFGLPDDRVLPKDNPARAAIDDIRTGFTTNEANPIEVVAPKAGSLGDIDSYAGRLSALHGVSRVDAITGFYVHGAKVADPLPLSARYATGGSTWFNVVYTAEPMSAAAVRIVDGVRATAAPFDVLVGGQTAQLVDSKASLFGRLPWALGLIALVSFVVLFLMFGSLLVPAKALVLNLLSLTATFGAMVWIFQEGHLSGLLHFTPTGLLDSTSPILMFCIAFGLSMDFEFFLLSRIKEEHDAGRDTVDAVAIGLERTGRIVTAAAGLIAVVFLAFSTSNITFIKLFGVGLALAVVLDATVIRATLVPAFMRLAGEANWWAPKPLRRFHDRFGISDAGPGVQGGGPRSDRVTDDVLRSAARYPELDLTFLDLETERALQRGVRRERKRPLLSSDR
ncbi:MAG: putative drug exporter of the superfamily [Actinomycetota bacterium]|nr:putative drug exporter of the superfamily [Actinomycetota bacterium]